MFFFITVIFTLLILYHSSHFPDCSAYRGHKGEIVYTEVLRENVRKLEAYVEEMARSDTVSGAVNIQRTM